ncbi:hypothetical protein [Pseudogemmobacter blasticus]|nr:hypothetical protein [Fuscovulum blasticum]
MIATPALNSADRPASQLVPEQIKDGLPFQGSFKQLMRVPEVKWT